MVTYYDDTRKAQKDWKSVDTFGSETAGEAIVINDVAQPASLFKRPDPQSGRYRDIYLGANVFINIGIFTTLQKKTASWNNCHERLSEMSDLESDAVPDSFCGTEDSGYEPMVANSSTVCQDTEKCDLTDSNDVVILYHKSCRDKAITLQTRLEAIRQFTVTLGEEYGRGGQNEVEILDDLVDHIGCILLLLEENYVVDPVCYFAAEVSLYCSITSFTKNKFVIPVFLEDKYKIRGLKPTMRAMRGIDYHDEQWDSTTESNFTRQIRMCLQNPRHLEEKFQGMQLTETPRVQERI
ncbi:uncharacterized protein LOC121380707 [Gigantopelta aegis]|uniref:uncharacterized protein LOC121380707 n=1 Tax=Gigantopelta aegis TaxID=1735272 RepID=UPI001B8896F6|nr:uncharacterized protein LOC121380707 [Gigantopelta aegis]